MNSYIKPLLVKPILLALVALPLFGGSPLHNMVPTIPREPLTSENVAVTRTVRLEQRQSTALSKGVAAAVAIPTAGARLVYAFFDDAVYTVTVTRASNVYGGATLLTGNCEGAPSARFQAVLSPQGVRHEIHDFTRGRLYQANGNGVAIERISELDDSLRLPKYDLSLPVPHSDPAPTINDGRGIAGNVAASTCGTVIDIAILFDSGAQTWAAAHGGMAAFANAAIAKLNTALANSGAECEFNLIHVQAVSYTTSGNLTRDLYDLSNVATSLGASALAARNAYGADLVSMFVETGSAYGVVGMGYFPNTPAGNESAAYTVCSIRSTDISHTLSHELGHNLGADHSKFQDSDSGPGLFPYAAGWFFKGNDNVPYHTIMSYEDDIDGLRHYECDYFSTPLKTFKGVAVGDATDGDNVRCLNIMAPVIAAYRASIVPEVEAPHFSLPHGSTFHSSITVTIGSTTTDANIHYTTDGTVPTITSPLYTVPLTLTQTTTLRARAFKTGLNSSAIASATYTRLSPILVTFNSQGGTAPMPAAITVTNTFAYGQLATTTRDGYTFAGWYANPSFSGLPLKANSIVTATADHTLYAKWIVWYGGDILCPADNNNEVTSSGSYDGFFYQPATFGTGTVTSVRGTLALKLTATSGRLTAKAVLQNASLSFSAKEWNTIAPDGTRGVTIATRNGETLTLNLNQERIWGTLSGGRLGNGQLILDGSRNRFNDRYDTAAATLLTQFRGAYTVALPPHTLRSNDLSIDAAPRGAGYLTLTVGTKGKLKIAGILADGTRVTRSANLLLFSDCGDSAAAPLFAPLYAKRGMISGLLWLSPMGAITTDRANNWFVHWDKPGRGPDGFSALLEACGGFYAPALLPAYTLVADAPLPYWNGAANIAPVAMPTNVPVVTSGTRLSMNRSQRPRRLSGEAGTYYEYDPLNPANATLSFAARTGIFKGAFTLYYDYEAGGKLQHKAVRASYAGILTPIRNAGFNILPVGIGYWIAPDNTPAAAPYKLKRSQPISLIAE